MSESAAFTANFFEERRRFPRYGVPYKISLAESRLASVSRPILAWAVCAFAICRPAQACAWVIGLVSSCLMPKPLCLYRAKWYTTGR